jgi:hypothetical protein
MQAGDDVGGFEDGPGGGDGQQPGVIIEDIEDLSVGAASEPPVRHVGLP